MTTLLLQFGNWLLLLGAVLFVLAVVKAVRAGRQARDAAYYGIRQGALNKTRRWSVVAAVAFIATGGLAFYLDQQPRPIAVAHTATPTPVLVSVPSRMLPTATPLPSIVTQTSVRPTTPPRPTPSLNPTVTSTVVPTITPPPNLPDLLLTPVSGARPVSPNAKFTFTTLASVADNKGNPVDPGLAFPAGTRRVRLYFRAAGVNNGATWSVLCYQGDQIIDSVVDLWEWGSRAQNARAFCGLDGSPGEYTAVGYLGPIQQFAVEFELLSPTPTATP